MSENGQKVQSRQLNPQEADPKAPGPAEARASEHQDAGSSFGDYFKDQLAEMPIVRQIRSIVSGAVFREGVLKLLLREPAVYVDKTQKTPEPTRERNRDSSDKPKFRLPPSPSKDPGRLS